MPKNYLKYIPSGERGATIVNEAFKGLNREESMKLENWQFSKTSRDSEILGRIDRGEAYYTTDFLETVDVNHSEDFIKNAWSIQSDVTGTLATLKSHYWPGFMAYHRCNTDIVGFVYMGDGICNSNLPFMV